MWDDDACDDAAIAVIDASLFQQPEQQQPEGGRINHMNELVSVPTVQLDACRNTTSYLLTCVPQLMRCMQSVCTLIFASCRDQANLFHAKHSSKRFSYHSGISCSVGL